MIRDLIKLADFLDQKNKTAYANHIDKMLEKLAEDPETKPFWEDDMAGEFEMPQDRVGTEIMSPERINAPRIIEAPPEIVDAVHKYLADVNQELISIVPEPGQGVEGEPGWYPPSWSVRARELERPGVPPASWIFWEDPKAGIPIEGKDTFLYGEW